MVQVIARTGHAPSVKHYYNTLAKAGSDAALAKVLGEYLDSETRDKVLAELEATGVGVLELASFLMWLRTAFPQY